MQGDADDFVSRAGHMSVSGQERQGCICTPERRLYNLAQKHKTHRNGGE